MLHISEQKIELRAAILERIRHMNEQQRAAESRSIALRILEALPKDRAVCVYYPLSTEPDLLSLLAEILTRNQPLFLPAFDGQNLVMHRVLDLSQLQTGSFGIPEPSSDAEILDTKTPVTVLIPGRAFGAAGGRLGRGNGGYDRWITAHRQENAQSRYFGVAFDCQMVNSVPMEEHDAPVDGVFTPRGFVPAQK
ncbi:MAG: 5-formyltetrahydrofolate cyclo-ligase [Candidatus Peribacteraceae bacterium]|nr:5-formyltetrahydrofolate cyclo-ligase [Candidatus Peribacteraceae bacterium]MDD5742373.1 5-formyltetrahydrofolate cyclo-ligase [Candidatus Peribacteraceae bacterium]